MFQLKTEPIIISNQLSVMFCAYIGDKTEFFKISLKTFFGFII